MPTLKAEPVRLTNWWREAVVGPIRDSRVPMLVAGDGG